VSEVEHVLAVQNRLGEGPRWNVDEQALYWVDIENDAFHRFDPATGAQERCVVGLPVSALGFRAAGGLILATRDGFAVWEPETQALRFLADPEAHRPESRFNDGAVDCRGRFWAGTMSVDPTSSLYRLDPDGSVQQMETGLTISNGIGWSPDNRTMYLTDTPRQVIYAYDFDAATGAIANRRLFVATPDELGGPDGLAVDSEGGVWSARWGGWKVTRYDPGGAVEREIRLPVECPTSCNFGGAGLDELYITSAWTGVDPAQLAAQPWAGDLFRVQVGIKGRPESKYAG
jgi:sugar lactone lactonase YvrE